jgi:hypothetical protein
MKRILKGAVVIALLALILAGCELPSQPAAAAGASIPQSRAASYDSYWGPYYDASGKVEIYYLLKSSYGEWNTATATVPDGFVCVGGGAFCEYSDMPGVLTGSWPSSNLLSWNAQSKDHCYYGYHRLTSVAVAMRLIGNNGYYVPVADIKSHLTVASSTSDFNSINPWASAYTPKYLFSGGAQVLDPFGNWGQLLTDSHPSATYPSSFQALWIVGSKAHVYQDAKQVKAYSINYDGGVINNFGQLKVNVKTTGRYSTQPYARGSLTLAPTAGWVMTGVGGKTYQNNGDPVTESSGRLLTQLGMYNFPSGISGVIADTDFVYPASTNFVLYITEITKR